MGRNPGLVMALLALLVAPLALASPAAGEVTASVTPDTGLVHLQTVTVTVTGITVPPQPSIIAICQGDPWGGTPGSCNRLEDPVVLFATPASGEFSVPFTVRRFMDLNPSGRIVDCADPAEDCRINIGLLLSISGPTEVVASIPISFAPVATDVVVTPDTDLVDGQTVAVSGSGFTPGVAIGWCQAVYTAEPSGGKCGTTPVVVEADAGGGFSGTHQVARFMDVPDLGETVDCAAPATPCVIAAAETSDIPGTVASAPISFVAPPPRVVPSTGSTAVEGDSGTTDLLFPVSLSSPANQTVTVEWTTVFVADGSELQAEPGVDYQPASGTVTFAPGETQQSAVVAVDGDVVSEPAREYVVVSFRNPTNAVMGGYWGLGVSQIVDDDPVPVAVPQIGTVVAEGDSGVTGLEFPVTLSGPSSRTVTVEWATVVVADGPELQAEPGVDYQSASGTVTFAPGETQQSAVVSVNGDVEVEPDEYVVVSFRNPTNAVMGGYWGLGVGNIQNDD